MTTDITELAQSLKAAAEKATPGRIGDRIDGSGSIKYECHGYDGSLVLRTDHKNMEYGFIGDNSLADEEFFRACVPDSILALVEALEKAQATEAHCNRGWIEAHEQEARAEAAEQRIAELESRTVKMPDGWQFEECEIEGCENGAIFSVGTGSRNIHLCDKCAHEPQNSRLKKSPLSKRLPFKCQLASRWRLSDGRNKNDMRQLNGASLVYSGHRLRLRTSRYRYLHLWRQPRFRPQR